MLFTESSPVIITAKDQEHKSNISFPSAAKTLFVPRQQMGLIGSERERERKREKERERDKERERNLIR